MSLGTVAFLKALVLPPMINFLLIIVGFLINRKYTVAGRICIATGILLLALFSLTPVSHFLLKGLDRYPELSLPVALAGQQAIVVLSGGAEYHALEFGRAVDSASSLQRSHYAAFLHRQTNLPVLVTGGLVENTNISEAAAMAASLLESFQVKDIWLEEKALNTAQNAFYSSELLRARNINSIFLVTHAVHMPRAMLMFQKQGMVVTPAPTMRPDELDFTRPEVFVPTANALHDSATALHEYLGMLWYSLRY